MLKTSGLAKEILAEIDKLPIIDCHEHLATEAARNRDTIDVMTLFQHYCKADIEAAGLSQNSQQNAIFDRSIPLQTRWKNFKPYFDVIKYGSYAFPAFAYVRDILEIEDINETTIDEISQRLQSDNQGGLYKKIMQGKCNIETAIQCTEGVVTGDQDFFVYLCRSRSLGIYDPASINALEKETDISIYTLKDCVNAIQKYIADCKQKGAVGIKVGDAYSRIIEFDDVSTSEAERIFMETQDGIRKRPSKKEGIILENYIMRRQVEACIDVDLPVVIHTGYQAGNKNDIRNARSIHLWSLLQAYPKAKFDLFHGSFPYTADMLVLGKYFQNVTLNMCWMHIMSPTVSRRTLSEWLDAVPVNKIFAFGGDYQIVEKIYGHLQLAKMNVATVLADKIREGRIAESDAVPIARLLFYENPKRWYNL